jgi:hypothetical protein
MIGNVKRLIIQRYLPETPCTHCNQNNKLVANVYSEMFVLRILPFAVNKHVTIECINCKKAYPDVYVMSDDMRYWAITLKKNTRHPWFAYIGYVLIGVGLIATAISELKKL